MNEEDIEKIKEKIIDELVDKNVKTYYEDEDDWSCYVDDWKLQDRVKNKIKNKIIEKTNIVIDNNQDVINKAIKDLVADLLPSIMYDYLAENINIHMQQVLLNQRQQSVNECLNYIRNNLRV